MLEKNKIYEFNIIDNGINFEGIAKTEDGLTVFIQNSLKGETVRAKVERVNKSFAVANLVEIINKSEKRLNTDCKFSERCGGCGCRNLSYDDTINIKVNNVINTLKKQGISSDAIDSVYGMGVPYHYRNKVQYPVRNINGKNIMGMFEKSSHKIIQNDSCLIQDKITHDVARSLFDIVDKKGFVGYDEINKTGDIRNIMVRRGIHTSDIMCVLVVNNKKIVNDSRMHGVIQEITEKYNGIKSIILNINTDNTNVILSDKNVCLFGKEYIMDYIGEYKFRITANSFFQVNTIQAEVLYSVLKEKLKLDKKKTLLELYSGVGSIGIFLSDAVKNVYSVEIVKSAVEAAIQNANINDVKNIINVNKDATEETLRLSKEGKYFNYIVVDPPRKGLDLEGINLILKLQPEKIGYVSCNPATLARDLNLLSDKYKIESIDMVDMFPWTSHVECVVVMGIKENS